MPEIAIRVRLAALADAAGLARLDLDTWSTLHSVQLRPAPGEAFFDARHTPDAYLVAEAAGQLVGYVRLAPSTPLACNAHVRQIQGLAVADWVRGQGAARALLTAAMAEARAQGACRITLRVLGHNAPARRLYESMGFVVEGVLPGEFLIEGAYVDDVLMGRPL